MSDNNKLKQKIIDNLKRDPVKTTAGIIKFMLKNKGKTPFQAIDEAEERKKSGDIYITAKQFENN